MIRRPPRSTRTDTLFPTRRSSDLRRHGILFTTFSAMVCAAFDPATPVPKRMLTIYLSLITNMVALLFHQYAPSPSPLTGSVSPRSEEHTSELQSLMRISYAVFCLKKKKRKINTTQTDKEY